MPRWVISSPIHISSTQPVVRQMTISRTLPTLKFGISGAAPAALALEEEDVADGLGGRRGATVR